MSGEIVDVTLPLLCASDEEEVIDLQGNRKCVPRTRANPFIAIWQGECGGWMMARLSFIRDPRPVNRRGAPPRGVQRLLVGDAGAPVEGRPMTVVGLNKLKSRLQKALAQSMKVRKSYARTQARKPTKVKTKPATRAKARTKTAKRRK